MRGFGIQSLGASMRCDVDEWMVWPLTAEAWVEQRCDGSYTQEYELYGADRHPFLYHLDSGVLSLVHSCFVFVPVNRGWGSAPWAAQGQRATWWCSSSVSPPGAVSFDAAVCTAGG